MDIHKEIDTRGLNCPAHTQGQEGLADMESGQLLRVVATDSGSVRDFQALPGRRATSWWSSRPWAQSSSTCCAGAEGRSRGCFGSRHRGRDCSHFHAQVEPAVSWAASALHQQRLHHDHHADHQVHADPAAYAGQGQPPALQSDAVTACSSLSSRAK